MSNFSERDLRDCFGLFATGVVVAATNLDGDLHGITINSFSSVSLDPALCLFAIGNGSKNLEIFKKSETYCLNILAKSQLDLAKVFASSKIDEKWQLEKYKNTINKNPVFEKSLGFIECKHHKIIEAGDHHVFIGEIIDCKNLNDDEGLIYYRGNFC